MIECQYSICFDNNLTILAQISKAIYAYLLTLSIDYLALMRFLANTNYRFHIIWNPIFQVIYGHFKMVFYISFISAVR